MLPMVVAVLVFRVVLSSLFLSSVIIVYFSRAMLFEYDTFQDAVVYSLFFEFDLKKKCMSQCERE
jgi:hypothetical protein